VKWKADKDQRRKARAAQELAEIERKVAMAIQFKPDWLDNDSAEHLARRMFGGNCHECHEEESHAASDDEWGSDLEASLGSDCSAGDPMREVCELGPILGERSDEPLQATEGDFWIERLEEVL